jgi:DNA-directed RNA polymerase sigma subunit (sigma70/sigma32)
LPLQGEDDLKKTGDFYSLLRERIRQLQEQALLKEVLNSMLRQHEPA